MMIEKKSRSPHTTEKPPTMAATDAIDSYFFDKSCSKAELIGRLLDERSDLPAAQPYYRALESVGTRAADEAFLALRLVLAGQPVEDERIKRLRGAVAAGDREAYARELSAGRTRPDLPASELHGALEDGHEAHAEIDALHGELSKEQPSAREIAKRVERLRRWPQLASVIANWWDDPRVQLFIQELSAAGL